MAAALDFAFLPDFPLPLNALALFGALLLSGLVGGALARRVRLPAITGYLAVGMLLGQTGLGLLTSELLVQARVFVDISLGLILFELGRRLDFNWLRKDRALLYSGISESVLSFILVYVTLYYLDVPKLIAAVAAAIGISTSPAVIMLIAQEQRAEGQVTERALSLVAINSVLAFIVVTVLLAVLHFEYQASVVTVLLHPLYLLAGSLLLGTVAWYAALRLGAWLGKREERQFVMLIGLIIVTVGCATLLKLTVLLALLVFGLLVKNRDPQRVLLPVEIGAKGELLFIVLFVVTGAELDARYLLVGGAIGLAYIGARFAGKILGVMPWALMSGLSGEKAALLGLALTPMAEFAVAMVQDVWGLYPGLDPQAFAALVSAVIVLEIIGPLVVQYTLVRAGETGVKEPD